MQHLENVSALDISDRRYGLDKVFVRKKIDVPKMWTGLGFPEAKRQRVKCRPPLI